MKIKILRSCAGRSFSFSAGQVVDTPVPVAKDLIKAGHAEEVKPDGKGSNSTGKRAGNNK